MTKAIYLLYKILKIKGKENVGNKKRPQKL